LKYLRSISSYSDALFQLNKSESIIFIKFINNLLNDSHYLLDEILTKLPEIREIELEKENFEEYSKLDETIRQDKEEKLQSHSKLVTTFNLLANETIELFHFLSSSVLDPFLDPQMIERIAQMLNYFLYNLAGPRSLNLKVKFSRQIFLTYK
jgi:ubiquitin conjugation factor E4 B